MADTEKSGSLKLGDLREALAAFDLPFAMDIVEARDAEPKFLASPNEIAAVELRLSSNIT